MKAYINTPDIIGGKSRTMIEVEVPTADLIAELARRRPCERCANTNSVMCIRCNWCAVWHFKDYTDNFKEAE